MPSTVNYTKIIVKCLGMEGYLSQQIPFPGYKTQK